MGLCLQGFCGLGQRGGLAQSGEVDASCRSRRNMCNVVLQQHQPQVRDPGLGNSSPALVSPNLVLDVPFRIDELLHGLLQNQS